MLKILAKTLKLTNCDANLMKLNIESSKIPDTHTKHLHHFLQKTNSRNSRFCSVAKKTILRYCFPIFIMSIY